MISNGTSQQQESSSLPHSLFVGGMSNLPPSAPIATNTLILTNLPPEAFQDNGSSVKDLLTSRFGPLSRLVILKSFGRMLAVFPITLKAKEAKEQLHRTMFMGKELRVYYGQHTDSRYLNPEEGIHLNTLHVPEPEKNFLLSPPGSPPVGWVQTRENEPVLGGLDESLLEHQLSAVSLSDFKLEGGEEVLSQEEDEDAKQDAGSQRDSKSPPSDSPPSPNEETGTKAPVKVLQFGEQSDDTLDLPSIVINLSIDELNEDGEKREPGSIANSRCRIKKPMPVTARPPLPE